MTKPIAVFHVGLHVLHARVVFAIVGTSVYRKYSFGWDLGVRGVTSLCMSKPGLPGVDLCVAWYKVVSQNVLINKFW